MISRHLLRLMAAILLIGLEFVSMQLDNETDYCNLPHCGEDHIACNNNGEFDLICPPDVEIIDMTYMIPLILSIYNELRNDVAGGYVKGLLPAARMVEMQWCPELAYLAELKVITCTQEIDKCRSTKKAPYAGQAASRTQYQEGLEDHQIIRNRLNKWLEEGIYCNQDIIRSFPANPPQNVSLFTLALNDRNSHIGCAAVKFSKNYTKHLIFTCNFATNNFVGKPVYKESNQRTLDCISGCSRKYENLCSIEEYLNFT